VGHDLRQQCPLDGTSWAKPFRPRPSEGPTDTRVPFGLGAADLHRETGDRVRVKIQVLRHRVDRASQSIRSHFTGVPARNSLV
jgi:hypothetical protein